VHKLLINMVDAIESHWRVPLVQKTSAANGQNGLSLQRVMMDSDLSVLRKSLN
jgi:hypothetical protein